MKMFAKVCIVLLFVAHSVQAQSAFKISPAQAAAQSTNRPFELADKFDSMIKTHHQYPNFSIPREYGSNADAFMITGGIANSGLCAASATNAFQAVMKATETSNTTNLNMKAAYSRVANESARLLTTNEVEEIHNIAIETK